MQPGERAVVQPGTWVNAYGDVNTELHGGMRVTVKAKKNIAGSVFYAFEETEDGNFFWGAGFKPMRSLN